MKHRLSSKILVFLLCAVLVASSFPPGMVALANTGEAAAQAATTPTIEISIVGAYIGRDGFTITHAGGDTIEQALHNPTGTRPDASDWVNMQVLVNGVVTGWQAGVEGDRARLSFSRTLFNGATLTAGQTIDFTPGYKIEFFFWPGTVRFQAGDEVTVLHVPSGTTLLTHEVKEEPIVPFEPTHTILHIGDLQGHIDPHMARIATIINDIRAQQPNTIVVDAGDTLHGAPIANHFDGKPVIEAMNAIGFDAMVVGNHDFNFGSETLLERAGEANFPLLGGNIVYETTGESFLPGYTIVESGGLSVGIVGLTREGTPAVTHSRNIVGLDFLNAAQTADEIITEIENHTDVIIMLAHMDRTEELSALNAVSGKVIASISGDTHVTTVEVIDGVILADSGHHGQVVGRLDLKIENNVVVGHRHTFIPVDANVAADTHVEAIIAPYRDQINEIMNEEIGTSLIELDRRGVETNLGNLVADAMLANSGADIAIQNAGGIREIINVGPITVGEVTTALPFENFIVRIDITGAELIEILEHGVSMYPNVHGRYPVVAGVEFTFNPAQPAGERIVDVMIAGEPLDRNRIYTLATNCFLAGGGDGYTMFVGKTVDDTEVLLREAVIEYIREIETVDTRVDGRIQKTDELPPRPLATLIGRAVIPAETFIPGPTSGQFLGAGPINNIAVPFTDRQPVQGISAILSMGDGTFLGMSDNGFGDAANSPDYILTVYHIRPDFETGEVELLGYTRLKDPNRVIKFPIENENTQERYLTGKDFDPESFRIAPDGTWWFGDEFGPFIFQTDSNGVFLQSHIMIPGVMAPENPFRGTQPYTLPRTSGFEGMALSADGTKLYPMLERALIGDPQDKRIIFEFCLKTNRFTENRFFYRMTQGHMTGEMTAINENEFIVIERDGGQGATAVHKQLYVMDISEIDAQGFVAKRKIADLMDIADPDSISLPGRANDVGLGNPFSFPFVTVEAVEVLDPYTLVVTNDNNFPLSLGRNPVYPDNTEIIKIQLSEALDVELGIEPTEQRNVIFIHPDGTTQAQFTAARLLRHGVDGMLNWDRMPHVAFPRIHVYDSLQPGSVSGAVAHATGYRTNWEVYGLDREGRPLTTLMEEADVAGFSIGIINSGSITEPGSGAFVAQVADRRQNEAIALQILEQRTDVILGGGEQWFLPTGINGRHGAGRRTDGRNLIDEARALGYTVVYTAAELAAVAPGTRKILGLFAANNIFNDLPESVLRERGLPLYREGAPTLAEMTEAAIEILSRNRRGFFLVVEEEGTDNFGNPNNAEGTIEAALRADDALGVAMEFADTNDDTLVLTSSDSDAGGFSVAGGTRELAPAGQPLPERGDARTGVPAGGPIDGVGGTRGIPFVTPEGYTFGIAWTSLHDKADGTFIRAYGLNAEYVSGTMDNIDIHHIFEGTLFDKEIDLEREVPVVPVGNQRNVIFIHPDGTTQAQFTAARLLRHGVDGTLNWDRMPHVAFPRIHVNDSLQPGSVAGAVAHATGYRTNFDVYGLDREGRPLTTLMEEADIAGFSIGLINSGSITEPGSGAFVAQVEDRGENEAIALQILEQRPDVILGGGEQWFLPAGVAGRHGAGRRTDGRNLVEEARALGYTVVYTAAELATIAPGTRKVLGLFAANNIFNDLPESVLGERRLPLYREGAPTLAEMTEVAIEILSRNKKGFFLVVEEEGTDNFGNANNAEGTIEATLRADDALGVAMEFADINDNTLVLTTSDSDAGGFSVTGGMRDWNPAGQPLPERSEGRLGIPEGGPIDGVGGTRGIPFVTPEGFTFGIAWASRHDKADSTFVRAYGLNAEYVSGTLDNIDLYTIMRNALGVENVRPIVPQLALNKGWNLISTPIVLDQNRDSLFEILYGLDWKVAYGFCGYTQKWLLLDKESILNPIDAVFIFMLEEGKVDIIPFEGLSAPPAKALFGRWNLISLASLTRMRLDRALISVHDFERKIGHAAKVISPAFNSEQWNFTRIDTNIPKMHPFEGYWLFMDGEETLAGFTTTPLN